MSQNQDLEERRRRKARREARRRRERRRKLIMRAVFLVLLIVVLFGIITWRSDGISSIKYTDEFNSDRRKWHYTDE